VRRRDARRREAPPRSLQGGAVRRRTRRSPPATDSKRRRSADPGSFHRPTRRWTTARPTVNRPAAMGKPAGSVCKINPVPCVSNLSPRDPPATSMLLTSRGSILRRCDAAEADVARRGVDRLGVPSNRPVPEAVVRRTEVGTPSVPSVESRRDPWIDALIFRDTARIRRRTARRAVASRRVPAEPVPSPLPRRSP